jgi:hypothetical protein
MIVWEVRVPWHRICAGQYHFFAMIVDVAVVAVVF